ncbi:MAG: phage tail tape measure protein [Candidatus Aenigmatarchaeota archaeon]
MDKTLTIGLALVAIDKMTQVINNACGQALQKFNALQEKIKETSQKLAEIGTISYFAGSQILDTMKKPISAFAELEAASTQLRSVFMEANGEVPKLFERIDEIANKLGAKLPGTTQDFYNMAASMKALGVSAETIAGGALETAAYLGAVLKPLGVSYQQAAEYTVKFSEALGIAEKELMPFMDTVQRLAYMGVTVEEMKYAFSKLSGTLQALGLQGLENAQKLAPLVGWLIKTGYSGETVGTNLGNILNQLMKFEQVEKVNKLLQGTGIQLEFVDKKTGKFKGIEHMLSEFAKLQNLSPAFRIKVFEALLGSGEDAKIAMILATGGIEKYKEMQKQMAKQADLQQRVNLSLGTFQNLWEAFTGTMQNLLATIGQGASPLLKWLAVTLNTLTDKINNFAQKHQLLTKIFSTATLVVGGTLMVFGALGIALSLIFRTSLIAIDGIRQFMTIIRKSIPWIKLKTFEIWRLIGAQKVLNYVSYHGGFWKAVQFALYTTRLRLLQFAGTASLSKALLIAPFKTFLSLLKSIGLALRFLFFTPIGLKIGLIVAIAMAVFYYWNKLKAFFQGFWQGLREGFKAVLEPLKEFWTVIKIVFEPFKTLINFLREFLTPAKESEKTLKGWAEAGRIVGNIIAFVLSKPLWILIGQFKLIATVVRWAIQIFNLLITFLNRINLFEAGKKIIETLWQGMKNVAMKPVQVIQEIAQKIRNLLPFSSAKEGPLAMLHKVRIIETIADTVKPQPLIKSFTQALDTMQKIGTTRAREFNLQALKLATAGTPSIQVTISGITQNLSLNSVLQSPHEVASVVATQTKETIIKAIEEYFRRKRAHKAIWGGD